MWEIPRRRIQDMPDKERLMALKLVRMIAQSQPENLQQFGADYSEEMIIDMINKGYIKICMDENKERVWMEIYDVDAGIFVERTIGEQQ